MQTAQDNLNRLNGYVKLAFNNLATADNTLDAAESDKKKAKDATDKASADAKILKAKQDQANFKINIASYKADVVKAMAELDAAKSKLIAAQANATTPTNTSSLSNLPVNANPPSVIATTAGTPTALTNTSSLSNLQINANPPSVIATTAGTPSGYQNTCQFDSVPGLTSGDNSATAISLYFGNLLQNLLTIVKHDQTHNAIANAYNILTNSGNTAYSTNLVSSQSALNPQAGYPTMNYPGSSTTDLADYTAVNANINNPSSSYNTSNSQPCSGSYPLAYNCLIPNRIDF